MSKGNYYDAVTVPTEITSKAASLVTEYAVKLEKRMREKLLTNPRGGYRGNRPGWQRGGPKRAKAKDHPVPLAEDVKTKQISALRCEVGVWDHFYAQFVEFETFPHAGLLAFVYPAAREIKPAFYSALAKAVEEATKK